MISVISNFLRIKPMLAFIRRGLVVAGFAVPLFVFAANNPPVSDPSLNIPVDEASGAKYRKIALNGSPLSDEKPQAQEESDEAPEESYIDALSLNLRHDTTDVYIPLPSTDLYLGVRRTAESEVWNLYRNGLRPEQMPDTPFGAGWRSNLGAKIEFYFRSGTNVGENVATVIDDNGQSYRYVILYKPDTTWDPSTGEFSGDYTFVPLPGSRNDQQAFLVSLTAGSGGNTFTLKRKFGSTLTYDRIALRVDDDAGTGIHTYARLKSVMDRYGNYLDYIYNSGNATLIPDAITLRGAGTSLTIRKNSNGKVDMITDPNGNQVTYDYQAFSYGHAQSVAASGDPRQPFAHWQLNKVTQPGGGTVEYEYGFAKEEDLLNPFDLEKFSLHQNLTAIVSPGGRRYEFSYQKDFCKHDYSDDYVNVAFPLLGAMGDGYYPKHGLPMIVSNVSLPEGGAVSIQPTQAVRLAYVGGQLVASGGRVNRVIDARGNRRDYEFTNIEVQLMEDFATIYKLKYPEYDAPRVLYFKALAIRYFEGTSVQLGVESFSFSSKAGMAVVGAVDFSGNITQYEYADEFSVVVTPYASLNLQLSGFYGDPTRQVNDLGGERVFRYGAGRIMDKVTNELGDATVYRLDSQARPAGVPGDSHSSAALPNKLGRRISETQFSALGAPVEHTVIDYPDTWQDAAYGGIYTNVSLGFVTRRTVKKLASMPDDPTWVADRVTVYVPDVEGRVMAEVVDPDGLALVTSYEYYPNGNKKKVTDPKGNVTQFEYDGRNRLRKIVNADLTFKEFFYDLAGNKVREVNENGSSVLREYDLLNRVVTEAVDLDGNGTISGRVSDIVTNYEYDALGARTSVTDPRGMVTEFEYDALRRLVVKTEDVDDLALQTSYAYETSKNPGGSVFDSSGWKPTLVTDPRGYDTKVTYDALYRPIREEVEYAAGLYALTEKKYDAVGNLVELTAPKASAQSAGTVTKMTYDSLRRPVSVIEAFGTSLEAAVKTNFYTSTGLLHRVVDALAQDTLTEYDGAGRAIKVSGPSVVGGRPVVSTYYDDAGNVSYTLDPRLHRTDYTYDARNRCIEVQHPSVLNATSGSSSRPTIETAYDAVGNVLSVTDARGNTSYTVYDRAGRPTHTITPPVDTKLASGSIVGLHIVGRTVYDANGNAEELYRGAASSPASLTTAFNPYLVSLTDMVKAATNTYDGVNRLVETEDAEGIVVGYEYDESGNRTAVVDGKSQRTEFTYDGLGRLLTTKDPALKESSFEYDAVNKVARVSSSGRRTEYQYDDRRRLTHVLYVGRTGDNRVYAYDALGRITDVSEAGKGGLADVHYEYDAGGRMTHEMSAGSTHVYGYDLSGNRISVNYGGTSTGLISEYDSGNRLTRITEAGRVTSYGYDLNGNRVTRELPNSDLTLTNYDALNRQLGISTEAGGVALSEIAHTYDLAGNLAIIHEDYSSSSALTDRLVENLYDSIDRLAEEKVTEGAKITRTTYAYDDANNREEKVAEVNTGGVITATVEAYFYNSLNQLQRFEEGLVTTSYTYDDDGNRLTRTRGSSVDTYAYDYDNRLVSLAQLSGGTTNSHSYVYDYRTRRVQRMETGNRTKIVFSGGVSVAEWKVRSVVDTLSDPDSDGLANLLEYAFGSDPLSGVSGATYSCSCSGYTAWAAQAITARMTSSAKAAYEAPILQAEFIRGSDWGGGVGGLLYSMRAGVPSYKHYNGRGDVVSATNAAGGSTWQAAYEAFGTRTQESGSTLDRQKGNTKEEDPTGLLNEGFRYRDLETGIFITRDPLGFVDGPNMYTYVVQNPWSKFDPEGLWLEDLFIAVPSIALGAKSLYNNIKSGNIRGAIVDSAGIVADVGAAALPGVPGGAGLAIKAARATVSAAQKIEKVGMVVDGVEATVDAAQNGDVLGAVTSGASTALGAKASLPGGKTAKATQEETKALTDPKTYETYTKTNPKTGEVYTGRTSGTGTPAENVAKRDSGHHMDDQGFGPAVLDKSSTNKDAIRGREQQLIDSNGGAKSQGGTSGNAINGVSPSNPKKDTYQTEAEKEFDKKKK